MGMKLGACAAGAGAGPVRLAWLAAVALVMVLAGPMVGAVQAQAIQSGSAAAADPGLEALRDSLVKAQHDGKAILIAPLVGDSRAQRGIDVSPVALETLWEKVDGDKSQFGLDRDAVLVPILGERMGIYIVSPGTYRLAASGYHTLSDRNSRDYTIQDKLADDGVGMVILRDSKDWKWVDNGMKWQAEQTLPGRVDTDYCSLVIAGSTTCLNTTTVRTIEERVVEPGRWVPDSRRADVDALVAMPTISQRTPFATIKVSAGEVLLLDSFVAANPNYLYDEGACIKAGPTAVACRMRFFQLFLHRVSVDEARAAASRHESGKMRQLLGKMQYRPYTISARDDGAGKWGEYYMLTEQAQTGQP